jgi:hypothetical protein
MSIGPGLGSVVPTREGIVVNSTTVPPRRRRIALLLAFLLVLAAALVAGSTPAQATGLTVYAPWDSGKTFAVGSPDGQVGGGYYGHCCTGYTTEYYAVDINGPGGGNADCGENVRATSGGTVSSVGSYGSISYIRIDHGGYTSEYQHVTDRIAVNATVSRGDVIAKFGNVGTTYCHLHFVVKLNGTSVAPSPMSGVNLPASGGAWVTSNNDPSSPPTDIDGDGVVDSSDQCPTAKGTVANNGCPANKPILAADVNGDGKADLLHLWTGGVNTWTSNGNGTYSVSNPYLPSGYSMTGGFDFKVGDFNGDGKSDLAHLWTGGVNTWTSNGNGTYAVSNPYKPTNYTMTGSSTVGWEIGDFNGDGKTDLAHLWTGGINTWTSNGNGTYTVSSPYLPSGYSMTSGIGWKVADFNGDGKADLAHLWSGGVNTWLSNGNGTYTVSSPYKPSGYSMTSNVSLDFKVGDFNGDGKADLAHLWYGGVNTWLSDGDGTYTVSNPYLPTDYNMASGIEFKVGDVNGDGKTDLLHLWTGGTNTWISNGDGTYSVSNPYKPTNYDMTSGFEFTVGDANFDGKADLLHLWTGGVNTWASDGNGTTYAVSNPYKPTNYTMTGSSTVGWRPDY